MAASEDRQPVRRTPVFACSLGLMGMGLKNSAAMKWLAESLGQVRNSATHQN
jgi:hypothetical protein